MELDRSLDELGIKYETDKASPSHNYLNFYEQFFAPLRKKSLTLLEIGVQSGCSVKMWEEYFPNAKIIGADIDPLTIRHNRGRVTIELLDQSNIEELTCLGIKHGPFDIIIEDGSHFWEHQITSLKAMFPFLKSGGFYVTEDLITNYGSLMDHFQAISSISCMEYLKKWSDLLVGSEYIAIEKTEDPFLRTYGRAADFMAFCRSACLIKKRFLPPERGMDVGHPLAKPANGASLQAIHILSHVSYKSDVISLKGYINFESDRFTLQGFSLHFSEDILEHRVQLGDGTWTAWMQNNAYAGLRSHPDPLLTGFTIRLRGNLNGRYALRAIGRFVNCQDLVAVGDGQDCISPKGTGLCGIQVELLSRTDRY